MDTETTPDARPLRADAERNRQALLDAASAVFAECGVDVSVAEIARRAGVGQGTVFRRFPTKELLFTAVVERHMLRMIAVADDCLRHPDPWGGLRTFMEQFAATFLADRALNDSAREACVVEAQLVPVKKRMEASAQAVLERAQEAGVARADVTSVDLFLLVVGASQAAAMPAMAGQPVLDRLLTLMLDGLRPAHASALPGPPPVRLQH